MKFLNNFKNLKIRDSIFWAHVKKNKPAIVFASLILILQAAMSVALPLPIRFLFDTVLSDSSPINSESWIGFATTWSKESLLIGAVVVTGLLFTAVVLLNYLEIIWITKINNRIVEGARNEISKIFLSNKLSFIESQKKADLVGRLSHDTEHMESILGKGLPVLVRSIPNVIFIFIVVGSVSMRFAVGMAFALIFMVFLTLYFGDLMRRFRKKSREEVTNMEATMYQSMTSFPLVKALSFEGPTYHRIIRATSKVSAHILNASRAEGLLISSMSSVRLFVKLLIYGLGGYAVLGNDLTMGNLILFISYIDQITRPVNDLHKFTFRAAKGVASIERLDETIRQARENVERDTSFSLKDGETFIKAKSRLTIDRLTFGFDQPGDLIKNLSLEFKSGDFVTVLGPSGSGKSTFLKLLNHSLESFSGQIFLDSKATNEMCLREIRQNMTLMNQEIFLIRGSLRENLQIASRETIDEFDLWSSLEKVGLASLFRSLPEGLDTAIGEGGLRLSVGQSRRVHIAQALLRNSLVYLFDEATAGLDRENSKGIADCLRRIANDGKIVVLSTHDESHSEISDYTLHFKGNSSFSLSQKLNSVPVSERANDSHSSEMRS